MGLRLRDYKKHQLPTGETSYADAKTHAKKIRAIVDSHSPTPVEKLYQVNIEASGGGVKSYALFKQIPKQLVY